MAEEEVEALQSIYGDELIIERNLTENSSQIVLSMKIRPAVSNSHCPASIRAVIELPEQYPKVSPKVQLRQPRGLDESNLNILRGSIDCYIEENVEMPVLFDVFQMIQEFLETEQNVPCAVCPICLNGFSAETASVCTSNCDHYIHQPCFACYIHHSKDDIERELSEWPDDMKSEVDQILKCPVCRVPLNGQDLLAAEQMSAGLVEADENEGKYETYLEEWRVRLRELQPVYERQKANGGLIDLEEERKRNLITDDTVFERQPVAELSSQQSESSRVVESVEESSTKHPVQFPGRRNFGSRRPCSINHYRNMGIRNYQNHFRNAQPRIRRGTQDKRGFASRKANNHAEFVELENEQGLDA